MASLAETLTVLCEYYAKEMGDAEAGIYISALNRYPEDAIEAAAHKHIAHPDRGRFFPKVADLMRYLPDPAAHPGADEAWSIALRLADESDSVTTTSEILEAWLVAQPVYLVGDKIGARMAFRDAYTRLVNLSTEAPKWTLSLGHDPDKRELERDRAISAGLLPAPDPMPTLEFDGSDDDAAANLGQVARHILSIFERMDAKEAEAARARHAEMEARRASERARAQELQRQAEMLAGGMANDGDA